MGNAPVDTPRAATDAQPAHHTRQRVPELLAPAGGPEPFWAALAAGADAIYCGMGSFNARRKAANFTDDAFADSCRSAHLAGARAYVTVNVVIKDAELPEAVALVQHCAALGADAFIIQDWGLFREVRRLLPELEIHVSTQANIHDARGTAWCRDHGAERVTLSRELSIAEIDAIHRAVPDVDLEVFAHGSICFSYSGICLLSSFACAGRSANRGMCAQPCRLPYELVDERGRVRSPADRGRPLCPRDTNTTALLPELIEAGASALKLEGRMKAPEYVFAVTDAYRRALDEIAAGTSPSRDAAAQRARQLKRAFNRDFTCAYQLGTSGDEMMSYERSNNRGQEVGVTAGFTPRRAGTKGQAMRDAARGAKGRAAIRLTEPVGTGDLLELRHDDDPDRFLTGIVRADAAAGETIEVEIARPMPAGCRVRLIRSQRALDDVRAALAQPVPRRRAVDVTVRARLGEPFAVTLTCCDDPTLTATATGAVVEAARTRAVTADDLIEHVGRLGTSPFAARSYAIELDDGCGMGFSAVHRVRAEACAALEAAILEPYAARSAALRDRGDVSPQVLTAERAIAPANAGTGADSASPAALEAPIICACADTLDAADAARAAGATRIYLSVDALDAAGVDPADAVRRGLIPVLDEVSRAGDLARLDRWVRAEAPVAVGTISELALAQTLGAYAEVRSCIPAHNRACLTFLADAGAKAAWLSPELTLDEIARLGSASPLPLGLMVSGRPRVMTSEHCILQVADACCHDCARCRLRTERLALRNIDGKRFPVRTDAHGRSRLYAAAPLDLTPQFPQLLAAGVTRFLVDGTLLDAPALAAQVTRACRGLDAARAGRRPAPRQAGASVGCLFVGVD